MPMPVLGCLTLFSTPSLHPYTDRRSLRVAWRPNFSECGYLAANETLCSVQDHFNPFIKSLGRSLLPSIIPVPGDTLITEADYLDILP